MKFIFILQFLIARTADVHRKRTRRQTVNLEPSRLWSQTDPADHKIVLPWSVSANHPFEPLFNIYMMNMGKDLGCMKTVKIEREHLNSTIWKQGLLFYWDQNTTSSTSYIGLNPGGTIRSNIDSLQQFGAPSTWQIIVTAPNSVMESVLQHEVLHALGFKHEHSRTDRDQYLHFDKNLLDSNYAKMNSADPIDSKYPFEMQSVMIYADTDNFTKKTGEPVTYTSPRLTTTDALQVQELYCTKKPTFELKEHVWCSKKDELGYYRPVFLDRICDGTVDCHDGSDEDESRFECSKTMGCCEGYRLWDDIDGTMLIQYDEVGQFNDRPYYIGFNRFTKKKESLFCIQDEYRSDRWFIGGPENPTGVPEWMLGLNYVISLNSCPPDGSLWSRIFMGRRVSLECFHKKRAMNYCNEASCDVNANCIDLLNRYKCECNSGFTGDGKFCTAIIENDECATKQHDCSENAVCLDQRFGFTCACKQGFIDRNSANPGRICEDLKPSNGCCDKFQVIFTPQNSTIKEVFLTCSIKEYSSFRFPPMRQSYKCDIEKSIRENILSALSVNLGYDHLPQFYFEFNSHQWVIVIRDKNMNLISKNDIGSQLGLQPLLRASYKHDLCFTPDISEDTDEIPADEEALHFKCLHSIGPK